MKPRSLIPITLLALGGADAILAQDGLTRAEVRAQLAHALRTGDIVAPGEAGLLLNQVHPHRYPAMAQPPGKSREEIRTELAEARRAGDLLAGESSYRLNEAYPQLYPAVAMEEGRTRDEVKSELVAAIRSGEITVGGELALKARDLSPGRYRDGPSQLAQVRD